MNYNNCSSKNISKPIGWEKLSDGVFINHQEITLVNNDELKALYIDTKKSQNTLLGRILTIICGYYDFKF